MASKANTKKQKEAEKLQREIIRLKKHKAVTSVRLRKDGSLLISYKPPRKIRIRGDYKGVMVFQATKRFTQQIILQPVGCISTPGDIWDKKLPYIAPHAEMDFECDCDYYEENTVQMPKKCECTSYVSFCGVSQQIFKSIKRGDFYTAFCIAYLAAGQGNLPDAQLPPDSHYKCVKDTID